MDGLILLLGAGAIAAYLVLNKSTTTGSGGGGGDGGVVAQGADSGIGSNPTIYQIPADSFAGFPASNTLDLSSLLKLITPDAAATPDTSKKAAVSPDTGLDAGAYVDSNGNLQTIKKPYISDLSKKSATLSAGDVVGNTLTTNLNAINPFAGLLGITQPIGQLGGGIFNLLYPSAALKADSGIVSQGQGVAFQGTDSGIGSKKDAVIAGSQPTWNSAYIYNQNAIRDANGNVTNPADAQKATDAWMNWISGDPNLAVYNTKGESIQKYEGMIVDVGKGLTVGPVGLSASDAALVAAQGAGKQGQAWDNIRAQNPGNTEYAATPTTSKKETVTHAATSKGSSSSGGGSYASRSGWSHSSSGALVH